MLRSIFSLIKPCENIIKSEKQENKVKIYVDSDEPFNQLKINNSK